MTTGDSDFPGACQKSSLYLPRGSVELSWDLWRKNLCLVGLSFESGEGEAVHLCHGHQC